MTNTRRPLGFLFPGHTRAVAVIEAQPPAPAWEQALRLFGARLLEASPGLVTWIMLLAPAWIPIIFHTYGALVVAVAVLVFDAYWVLRAVSVVTGVYSTLLRMRRDMRKDWLALCREAPPPGVVDPLQFFHLSVVPTYTEPYHVLERTIQAIVDANYPDELKLIGIITRETDKPGWENVARLKEKFGGRVRGFYHIKDPLEPGIVIGKSAAMNWGGRWMVRVLTDEGYDLDKVLITDLDSDYRVHSQPHRLVAFSSYTCSLDFVHRIGYWDKDVIPEDSRFYWKAFFTFGKRFSVKSVWLPIYGDSPQARDYAATHVSQYNQIKRWAWGITDVPYVLTRFFQHPEIPLRLRFRRFMNLFLNHLNWIFLPVLLIFGASVPLWASVDFSLTDIGQFLWTISGLLLGVTLSTVIFFLYFEIRLLPPKPREWPLWKKGAIYLEYLLYPIVGLVMSVLPALEAHTRLLLGRYLEYRVTEKV